MNKQQFLLCKKPYDRTNHHQLLNEYVWKNCFLFILYEWWQIYQLLTSCFCIIFDGYYKNFIFWKEWALGPLFIQFWQCRKISLFPKIPGLKLSCNSCGNSYRTFFYSRYPLPLYFNFCKAPKHVQDFMLLFLTRRSVTRNLLKHLYEFKL